MSPVVCCLALALIAPPAGIRAPTGPSGAESASESPASAPLPEVLRFSPETLDLGETIANRPASGRVTITNISDAPVTIAEIVKTCGCTTVSAPPTEPLAPGASWTIDVTIQPGNKAGVDFARLVHVRLEEGGVRSFTVRGHVKTIVAVVPEVINGTTFPEGALVTLTLTSVENAPFRITGIEPPDFIGGVVTPTDALQTHVLEVDLALWAETGRSPGVAISTDHPDAALLMIPIKATPLTVMFRLPGAESERADREALEAAQDAILHAIDARIAGTRRSREFALRLHRESGMLFVHGTDSEVARVRAAIELLPPSAGVQPAGR